MSMNQISNVCGALLAGLLMVTASAQAAPSIVQSPSSCTLAVVGSHWIAKSADSVVGVSEARQVTNPAKIDYEKLMKATPEMKELRKEGIDKTSARGQTLVTAARDRIRRAARSVMTAKGHCSVWKKISHKDKRTVTDITEAVKAKLGK